MSECGSRSFAEFKASRRVFVILGVTRTELVNEPSSQSDTVADSPGLARVEDFSRTEMPGAESTGSNTSLGLQVRCPHCREPFTIANDTKLTELSCPACTQTFSLASQTPVDGAAPVLATIAHFELLARVGVGGFGTVWKARDTRLDRIVAVKVPRKEQLDPQDVENFLHEAKIAAQLSHPNIVRIFEVGRDGDTVYLVSEFMKGKSLLQWSEERQLSTAEAVDLTITIFEALAEAHRMGVIHRDLKPQNILMDERGEPHITDFGLAKRLAADVTRTIDGKVMGTPAYMSPEQARGATSQTDQRTDLYSMGVVLFQLLTDELPFRGNLQRLIYHVIHDDPPRLRELDPTLPVDLETICMKLLEKEPARRYGSAREVADELRRFRHGEPIHARPIGMPERLLRWVKRHPTVPVLFAGLVAVMVVVSMVSWRWYRMASSQTERALTAQVLRGGGFTADSVSHSATRQLEEQYRLIEALATSHEFLEPYFSLIDDPQTARLLDELNEPDLGEARREELRRELLAQPAQRAVQQALQAVSTKRIDVFGWFVMRDDGLQVARWPVNDTIGLNYSWRTYFHGETRDYKDAADYARSQRSRIDETHLSAAFVTQVSDRWVISISTPLRRPATHPQAGEFAGIVALMFEVGQIAELPGSASESEFAVLVDSREGSEGMILQHPLYDQLLAAGAERIPEEFQTRRVDLKDWTPGAAADVELRADYHDPLGLGGLGENFSQRWLAAKAPVLVRGEPTGLVVIVQQSYRERIGNGLERLDRQVRLLLGASLGLVLALVVPLWAFMLRRLDGTTR